MANPSLLRILAGVSLALALGACDGDKTKSPADGGAAKNDKGKADKDEADKGDDKGGDKVAAADGDKGGADEGAKAGADAGGEKVKVVDAGADERFDLVIEGPADAKAGAEGQALVRVVPKGPWHMNLDFPTKLLLTPGDGVKVASGELKKGSDGSVTISWNENLQYMGLYHLFGVFWTTQFIAGFGVMMTAGAIASYYWQREEMPRGPIRKSIGRATRYHLGSIALGSFIVAVVQFVRAIMEYVNKKTKKLQDTNPVVKLFMCCIRYCLWYLEKVLKYINRNAYILVAVKGYSYCYSAVQAIKLIILNMMRIAAVNTVGQSYLLTV